MKTLFMLICAICTVYQSYAQEGTKIPATGTLAPATVTPDPTEPQDTANKTEEKSNRELLLELLEKEKQERVGYFQVSKGFDKTFTINKEIDDQTKTRINILEKEIEQLYIRMESNKIQRKELEGLKPDSVVKVKTQELRKSYLDDSITWVVKHQNLKSIQIPEIYFDSIYLFLENARLNRIVVKVKGDNGYYSNNVPISVTSYSQRTNDKLFYQGSNESLMNSFIIIGNFLNYVCLTDKLAYPPDTNITISSKTQTAYLSNNGKQLDYFDVRLYTDTKGLSGESNGLVQTEINTSFYGSTKNISNCHATWVPYVRLHLGLSKFDSKFDTLNLNSLSNRSGVDYLKMVQYSSINLRVEFDLIRYSRIHDGYLTIGHQMQSTIVSDTNKQTQRIFSPSFYTTLGGSMFNYPRMKCDFRLPIHYCYLTDQPFTEYKKSWEFMIVPEIELVLDPSKKTGSQSEVDGTRIFGRVKYFDLTDYRGGNFWQVQLGAQISLSDVLKK